MSESINVFQAMRDIYTQVADTIIASYSTCRVVNAFIYAPDAFPTVSIVMSGDGNTTKTRDSSHISKFNDITATVDVYTNNIDGKKTLAEDIMGLITDKFYSLNFNLVSCKPNSNISNAQNYRLTATFVATVGHDGKLYSRRS